MRVLAACVFCCLVTAFRRDFAAVGGDRAGRRRGACDVNGLQRANGIHGFALPSATPFGRAPGGGRGRWRGVRGSVDGARDVWVWCAETLRARGRGRGHVDAAMLEAEAGTGAPAWAWAACFMPSEYGGEILSRKVFKPIEARSNAEYTTFFTYNARMLGRYINLW